jgi:hypothetical protein
MIGRREEILDLLCGMWRTAASVSDDNLGLDGEADWADSFDLQAETTKRTEPRVTASMREGEHQTPTDDDDDDNDPDAFTDGRRTATSGI